MIRSPDAPRQKGPLPTREPPAPSTKVGPRGAPRSGRSASAYRTISARKGTGVLSRSPVAGRRWMARTTSIPSTTRPNAA